MTPEIITPQSETAQTEQFQCRHIFTDGRRCGSPAIRGPEGSDAFCYYHHNSRRPIQDAPTRKRRQSRFVLPNPEDRSAIQQSIGEVLRRIASNDIDPRRAGLLLYGLQIASLNLPRTNQPRPNPAEPPLEIVSEVTHDPEHGLLAPPAELRANQPKSSVQRWLEEMDARDSALETPQQSAAPIDLQASAEPKVYIESTTPAQTVRPTHPSKSHRPINPADRKERSHEPRSTHDRRPVHPGHARATGSAPAQPGAPAAPDLHLRR